MQVNARESASSAKTEKENQPSYKLLAGELEPVSGSIRKHPALQEGYFGQTNKLSLAENSTVLEEIINADKSCNE